MFFFWIFGWKKFYSVMGFYLLFCCWRTMYNQCCINVKTVLCYNISINIQWMERVVLLVNIIFHGQQPLVYNNDNKHRKLVYFSISFYNFCFIFLILFSKIVKCFLCFALMICNVFFLVDFSSFFKLQNVCEIIKMMLMWGNLTPTCPCWSLNLIIPLILINIVYFQNIIAIPGIIILRSWALPFGTLFSTGNHPKKLNNNCITSNNIF